MMQGRGESEKSRVPAFCFGLGVSFTLLALLLLTENRAVALKGCLGVPEFPNHFLSQIVRWFRYAFAGFGIALMLSAWRGETLFSRLLAGSLFERVGEKRISAALFGLTFPAYLLLEWFVFQRFPATPDEFAYVFQAKILATGSVTAPAHPLQAFFTSAFIAESDGRLFSIMPPGWSFFLAPWVRAGLPWVANPLLSSLSVLLLFWIGAAVYNRTIGCAAAVLMAVSPFFAYMSGTFFAHPLSLFLVLAATYGTVLLEKRGGGWCAYLLLGIVMGLLPVVHHFDVFLLLPLFVLLAIRFFRGPGRVRGKVLLLSAAFLAVFASFTIWYNLRLSGSPTTVPHQVYLDSENFLGEIPRYTSIVGITSFVQLEARLRRLVDQVLQLNLVLFPLAPVFIFVPILLPRRSKWDAILTGSVLCLLIAYLFYWCRGGFQFGPRYYYPAVGFFYLLILRGFCALYARTEPKRGEKGRRGRLQRSLSLAFLLVVCFQVGFSAGTLRMLRDVADYARIIEDVGGWFEMRGIRKSLIFLAPSEEDRAADPTKIFLRVRNEPDFSDTNLTASDRGERNRELIDFYPDRRAFLYEIDISRLLRGEEMRWKEIQRDHVTRHPPPEGNP
jgi:hypothetical protein